MSPMRKLNDAQGQLYLSLPPTSARLLEGMSVDMCHQSERLLTCATSLNVRALFSLHTNYAVFPYFV